MLKHLEDSEDLIVGIGELQEQLEISEEAGVSITQVAQQAMKENGQHIFEIFRHGEEEACIASLARWNAELKGLVELERRCRNTMQEVKVLSETQDKLKSTVEGNIRLQSRATEKCYDQIFEEIIRSWKKRNQKRLCSLYRKSTIYGDIRMKEMKQEGCRDLETRER